VNIEAFAREERLERPTPGFGDQCSTN